MIISKQHKIMISISIIIIIIMSETGMDEEREGNDPKTVIPKQAAKQIFFRPNLRMAMIIKNIKNDNSLKQGKYMEWQRIVVNKELWSIQT